MSIDPLDAFAVAKQQADEARTALMAEEAKLRAEDKARRADLRVKLAAIQKLLGRKPRAPNSAKTKKGGIEKAEQR